MGDSHTWVFRGRGVVYSPGPITARNFTSENNSYKQDLDSVFNAMAKSGDSLVLCVGEVDMRAHYWRDFPVFYARGVSIEQFIMNNVAKLYDAIQLTLNTYGFDSFVLWGAPAASIEGKLYNKDLPFVGSTTTRNILIHLFNLSFIKCMLSNPKFHKMGFSTLFYNMIDAQVNSTTNFVTDGVHLDEKLYGNVIWEIVSQIISNRSEMVNEKIALGALFDQLKDHSYRPVLKNFTAVERDSLFDTWILLDDASMNLPYDRKISISTAEIKGDFIFVRSDSMNQIEKSEIKQLALEIQ